jgi:hypothetical protein
MSPMIHLHLSTGEYLVVEVPQGAWNVSALGKDGGTKTRLSYYLHQFDYEIDSEYTKYTETVDGSWHLIASTQQIAEDRTIMASICEMRTFNGFRDRIYGFKIYGSEFDNEWDENLEVSFSSLCQLHNIPLNAVWLKKQ